MDGFPLVLYGSVALVFLLCRFRRKSGSMPASIAAIKRRTPSTMPAIAAFDKPLVLDSELESRVDGPGVALEQDEFDEVSRAKPKAEWRDKKTASPECMCMRVIVL
jgi:hypothetical protein